MINLPTLRQLQYLSALHDTKNFRKAAEKCRVTQPTLSQAIQEMENVLGAKLLDRTRRKIVTFTPFGKDVLSTIKTIMPPLEKMVETAKQVQEPLSGTIRLGIIPTIAPYLLPDILPHLQKEFPKMNFQITEDMSHILTQNLQEGKIDIALLALPFDTKNMKQAKLFKEPFYCAAPKGTFTRNKKISLSDLENKNLLLLQDGHCLRDHVLSACKKSHIKNGQDLNTTSLHTLLQMVGQKYGLTLIPEMVLNKGIIPRNVTIHSFKNPVPSREIGLIWPGDSYKNANIMAVITKLKTLLKR